MGRWNFNNDKFIQRELEGEFIILNLDTGNYYTLDEVGGTIFRMITTDRSTSEIKDTLCHQYEQIHKKTIERDVEDLIRDLSKKKIIQAA